MNILQSRTLTFSWEKQIFQKNLCKFCNKLYNFGVNSLIKCFNFKITQCAFQHNGNLFLNLILFPAINQATKVISAKFQNAPISFAVSSGHAGSFALNAWRGYFSLMWKKKMVKMSKFCVSCICFPSVPYFLVRNYLCLLPLPRQLFFCTG